MSLSMGRELSMLCFDDFCDDCDWGGCQCRCHEGEEYHVLDGWVDVTYNSDEESET